MHVNDYALSEEDQNPYRSKADMKKSEWNIERCLNFGPDV